MDLGKKESQMPRRARRDLESWKDKICLTEK